MCNGFFIFVCQVCNKTAPCTLIVPEDTGRPETCPYNIDKPKWRMVFEEVRDDDIIL